MHSVRTLTLLASAAVAAALGGCETTNQFADNVTTYNLEAEKSADTAIVLNVLRASKRRPLTFLDLQTVQGSNPPSGSLAIGAPLKSAANSSAAISPTLNWSGGPTAATAVVNTQEFYKGILTPVSKSTVDLFVQRRISRDLLFNMMFSSIVVSRTRTVGGKKEVGSIEFRNYPGHDDEAVRFQRLVEVLVDMGLTTSRPKAKPDNYGPTLVGSEIAGNEFVSRSATAGLSVVQQGWCELDNAQMDDLQLSGRVKLSNSAAAQLKAYCKAYADGKPKALQTESDVNAVLDTFPGDARKVVACDDAVAKPTQSNTSKDTAEWLECRVRVALAASHSPTAFYQPQRAGDPPEALLCFDGARPSQIAGDTGLLFCSKDATSITVPLPTHPPATPLPLCRLLTEIDPSIKRDWLTKMMPEPDVEQLETVLDGAATNPDNCADPHWSAGVEVTLTPRSVYGIVYYLGELVRRANHADPYPSNQSQERTLKIRNHEGLDKGKTCSTWGDPAECVPIFELTHFKDARPLFLKVGYFGENYTIADAEETHKTAEVLDLVTELLALNRNAKDLPTSNVFTIRSGP